MTIKLSGNYRGELWAARCQKIVLRPARLHLIGIQSVSLCQALNKAIGSAGCTVLHNWFGGGKSGILFSCDSNGGDKCKQWKCCMHCCSAVWFSQLNHRNINRCPLVHCTGYQHTFMRTTPQSTDSICSTCIRLRHQEVWRLVGAKVTYKGQLVCSVEVTPASVFTCQQSFHECRVYIASRQVTGASFGYVLIPLVL